MAIRRVELNQLVFLIHKKEARLRNPTNPEQSKVLTVRVTLVSEAMKESGILARLYRNSLNLKANFEHP